MAPSSDMIRACILLGLIASASAFARLGVSRRDGVLADTATDCPYMSLGAAQPPVAPQAEQHGYSGCVKFVWGSKTGSDGSTPTEACEAAGYTELFNGDFDADSEDCDMSCFLCSYLRFHCRRPAGTPKPCYYDDDFDLLKAATDSGMPALRPQGADTTHGGCTCKSQCGASAVDNYSKCDWCYTTDNCGKSSLLGSWDYCVYPAQDAFEAQTGVQKMDQLWRYITHPSVVGKSAPAKGIVATGVQILGESMITPFDERFEVLPEGRSKVIHAQGAHCKFNLEVDAGSPFTGVLSPGSHPGLIRMGSATTLDFNIFPGFGIKFLRSKVKSADWVGLRATGPGGSWDFFEGVFSNHVAPPSLLVKLNKFQQASGCIDMVGLSDACSYSQEGEHVDAPVFPFEILFDAANSGAFSADAKKSNEQLLAELAAIPLGSTLFTVYAYASPSDKHSNVRTVVGTLKTTSSCVLSHFGDSDLFFRHQRMEEDFAAAPEWIPQMKELGDSVCKATVGPVSKFQCVPAPDAL